MSAEPDIVADGNRFSVDIISGPLPGIHGMNCCVKAGLRTDKTVVANGNFCGIKDYHVKIGEKAFAYMDVIAVVTVEGGLDENIIVAASKDFL